MLLLALLPVSVAAAGDTLTLTVRIEGLKSDRGGIAIAIYDSEQAFTERTAPLHKAFLPIEDKSCSWVLTDLTAGDYAVLVYHDRNGNEQLDTNKLRIPKEPYGFSNNARGSFGPPGFDKVRFTLSEPEQTIEIEVR
ncbi:hypothetical protein ABI59_05860 [Acidobacteria bacterium Mor1]|nr:hypothetical protein ABI59_05860 [Acidobacteria bacterium Mor1]